MPKGLSLMARNRSSEPNDKSPENAAASKDMKTLPTSILVSDNSQPPAFKPSPRNIDGKKPKRPIGINVGKPETQEESGQPTT